MTAILDGEFPPVVSAGLPAIPLDTIDYDALEVFSNVFQLENVKQAVPSSEVLAYFGSVTYPQGMVVADSFVNSIKSLVRSLRLKVFRHRIANLW